MVSKKMAVASLSMLALSVVAIINENDALLYFSTAFLFLDLLAAVIYASAVEGRVKYKPTVYIYAAMVLVGSVTIILLKSWPGLIMTTSVTVEIISNRRLIDSYSS